MLIPRTWTAGVLALTSAVQVVYSKGITDIKVTICDVNDCSITGYRKVPQDLNKFSRGQYVHLHFTDRDDGSARYPITHLTVTKGDNAGHPGEDWECVEGNLNAGTQGPPLTLYVKRDPSFAPIESLVVKYGFGSHGAIGYDRYPLDLNTGTGGQWVYLYYKRDQKGRRDPITHIAVKACPLPLCNMDDNSWTRVNRAIKTNSLTKRYIYLFYKTVPGEPPITKLKFTFDNSGDSNAISLGVQTSKRQELFLSYERASSKSWSVDNSSDVIDNLAVELGTNPIPYGWHRTEFDKDESNQNAVLSDWNAQIIYREGAIETPPTPQLYFREDGSFKIVQFADIHMATGSHMCFNAPEDKKNCVGDIDTLDMMERMLEVEKPDLVVFSGDNVDGLTSSDAYSTILKYSQPVVKRKIPWAIIFGNHDEEGDLSREEMMQVACDVPYSLSERGPVDIWGTGNYVLRIWPSSHRLSPSNGNTSDSRKRHQFALYFLDSGAYSFNLEHPGWDWIKENQVEWFRRESATLTTEAEAIDGVIPNALAFFHIPIPEYEPSTPKEDFDNDDINDSDRWHMDSVVDEDEESMTGSKREGVSTPSYNSGMFRALVESKDVRATTAGHDHLNDYCLLREGIQLCYGGGTGYGSYGSSSVSRRSRVFEILKHGARVDTWKRLDNEEMTMVDLQTLFVGPKDTKLRDDEPKRNTGRDRQSRRRPSTGKNRSPQEFWENVERGGQYVLGVIKNRTTK
ncbi:purple acid phosphatase [Actinomortierella wolfii]|nr:purple acid phosphatase [Actinomortierella wolfii]